MNIDLKSLNEIDFSELDLENIGSWPLAVKFIAAIGVALAVSLLTYNLFVSGEIEAYDNAVVKEEELRTTFKVKYAVASNLETYKQQMIDMEDKFSQLLKRLPTSNETPGLLDDLSYVGTTSGLTFNKIGWLPEIEKEFYTELPIKIEVVGSYHEFGEFVSKVAQLPRIVSLHDFSIESKGDERLHFSVVAKTYRYEEAQ
ncbi:type 4a pilus biogenesis protein PilO [Pseudoalteromonas tunicata]|jgi:type IV pilus assembly protein PilO|uniref:Putative Type IV pilus biogenesis protein PilO n=1 Tax=Pseudoalteromonas tunicata D2 TaxID=87626 RepID=A4CEN1_9GAMM|nr:type 4a pilus biogenesis protein PilO [Pseudoalteromonas tunicata]ATC96023.1 type IV pilus assembly protein PilO [Pseudoalteromonas tunicata]AXT31553.1 pilus assembly protein PilP [Pseudoalteromonas tunicata]EAR26760.1 putative Type IV pilus biogenesis protein PilO [Pseudoalteromonas tunicata D2]MDP4985256.1 type 4a pilus biogenesis protein PilO [Pseudoalteromonas tunicata]MDP5213313.1 type 4a pilus biogenesis protein PilO [Pseudoalteromonas tunicata]